MPTELIKGGNVPLTDATQNLTSLCVGLGWDSSSHGEDFDLDASCIMLNANNQVPSQQNFIFFGNLSSPDKAVQHQGDNITGKGKGDKEQIFIELKEIDLSIEKLVFVVTIFEAEKRNQNFGMVKNAYIRIFNRITNEELTRYSLEEEATQNTALIFGEMYKRNGLWKFRAVGQGSKEGLSGIAHIYGFDINPINNLMASLKNSITSGISKLSECCSKWKKRFFYK